MLTASCTVDLVLCLFAVLLRVSVQRDCGLLEVLGPKVAAVLIGFGVIGFGIFEFAAFEVGNVPA